MITVVYILGIVVQYFFNLSYTIILCGLFITIIIGILFLYRKKAITIFFCMVILLCGSLNFNINNQYRGKLEPFFNKNIYVVGDVVDISNKDNTKITINTVSILIEGKKYNLNDKVLIKLRDKHDELEMMIGKRVGCYGILEEPKQRRNPNMFDYQMYLKAKRIYSILYPTTDEIDIMEEGDIFFLYEDAYKIKKNIEDRILNSLSNREGGVLLGIFLGDKDLLDSDTYTTFKKVGIAHILAVSGLHVGIFYMLLNKILKGLPLNIKALIILANLCFYVMITGCAPSVLRATAMIIVLVFAPIVNRRYDSLSAICIVALLFLTINPILVTDIGFQLSFTAAISIILFYKPIFKKLSKLPDFLAQILAVTMAAQIGTIPVSAYHFYYISLGAFIVNIPIVIIVGYIVLLGILMILTSFLSFYLSVSLGYIISFLIRIMISLSNYVSAVPFSSVQVVSPNFLLIIFYYVLLLILIVEENKIKIYHLSRRKLVWMMIGLYIIVTGFTYAVPSKMEIIFVDVGQGDCILIKTPLKKNILIDGGGNDQKWSRGVDVGDDILVPYLLRNRIRKIHVMILSHAHKDHIGGLLSVLDHLKVDTFIMGSDDEAEDLKALKEKCMLQKTRICKAAKGDKIRIEDHLNMKILHPSIKAITKHEEEANNNSLVVWMECNGKNILFTGDIEGETEKSIIDHYSHLPVDVLKVAHHGSKSSTTELFIEGIKPKMAIIQVGKNHFGHPNKDVLNKLKKNNIAVFRNDENGAVILTFHKNKIKVKTMIDK